MGDRPLVLKISEVCALLRISRSAFYRKVCKDTSFPQPLPYSGRSSRLYYAAAVEEWLSAQSAQTKRP